MAAKKDEEIVPISLPLGTVFSSKLHDWVVEKELGKGGFGSVYLVQDKNDESMKGAMKVESKDVPQERSRIGNEARLMTCIRKAWMPHLLWAMDAGSSTEHNLKYLVMPLVGRSLDWLMENATPTGVFSKSTALKISIQMIEAIRHLHEIGVLHRDIKPANFAIGRKYQDLIYMLDYGSARYYRGPDGFLARPRVTKRFMGTPLYASRAMHDLQESSRADDMEQWLFTFFELFGQVKEMPWFDLMQLKDKPDNAQLRKVKDDFLLKADEPTSWKKMPRYTRGIASYIMELDYYSRPDYDYLLILLEEIDTLEHFCKLSDEFDWMNPANFEAAVKRKIEEEAKKLEDEKKKAEEAAKKKGAPEKKESQMGAEK